MTSYTAAMITDVWVLQLLKKGVSLPNSLCYIPYVICLDMLEFPVQKEKRSESK